MLSRQKINSSPTTKPARKRFAVVLKRRTLEQTGPKRTAHLGGVKPFYLQACFGSKKDSCSLWLAKHLANQPPAVPGHDFPEARFWTASKGLKQRREMIHPP